MFNAEQGAEWYEAVSLSLKAYSAAESLGLYWEFIICCCCFKAFSYCRVKKEHLLSSLPSSFPGKAKQQPFGSRTCFGFISFRQTSFLVSPAVIASFHLPKILQHAYKKLYHMFMTIAWKWNKRLITLGKVTICASWRFSSILVVYKTFKSAWGEGLIFG